MAQAFRVRVFPESGPPMILRGGADSFGPYVVTREPSGSGYTAVPEKRIGIPAHNLRAVNDGEADYELTAPMAAKHF